MTMGKRTYLGFAALALLLALSVGCTRSRNDMQVATDVQGKINSDANLPNKQITVNANNGVVTLSGTVGSDMERATAANDAAQIEGVKTVVNNLTVAPTSAQNMPPETSEQEPAPAPTYSSHASRPRATRSHRAVTSQSDTTQTSSNSGFGSNTSSNTMTSNAAPQVNTPPPPSPVTIPDGTMLSVRMIDSVDSDRNKPGDIFRATLDAPVVVNDQVIIPQGADVQGRVATLKAAGHYIGQSQIALELTKVSFNGRTYPVTTNQYTQQGASRGKNTAAKVGTGAAVGAIIGAIAGGGKGAGIGATIGAGAGGGVQTVTKGEQIHIRPEAVLNFRMESALTVTPGAHRNTTQYDNGDTYNDNNTYNDQNSNDTNNNNTNDDNRRPTLKKRPPTM